MTQYISFAVLSSFSGFAACVCCFKKTNKRKRLTVTDFKSDKMYIAAESTPARLEKMFPKMRKRRNRAVFRAPYTQRSLHSFCILRFLWLLQLRAVWGHKIAVIYWRQMHRTYQKYGSEMLRGNKVAGTPAWLPLRRGTPRKHENLAESDEKARCRGTAEILPAASWAELSRAASCDRTLDLCANGPWICRPLPVLRWSFRFSEHNRIICWSYENVHDR